MGRFSGAPGQPHNPITRLPQSLGPGLFRTIRYPNLPILARRCRKDEFFTLGTPAHAEHPVTAGGTYAPTLGTGAYALDGSLHQRGRWKSEGARPRRISDEIGQLPPRSESGTP
jgi:hypothetical protein